MSLCQLRRFNRALQEQALPAAALACFGTILTLSSATPARAAEFQAIPELGIEYKNEVKVNAKASLVVSNFPKASYNFLESTVTVNNKENKKKNLVICVYGYSKKFDTEVVRTEIDTVFDAAQKTLSCSLTQSQEKISSRFGQMGCRQITLAENQMGVTVPFVSGNRRTTIKNVDMKLQIDKVGPVQDGVRSADKLIAAGGAGAGGHPLVSPNDIAGKRERMDTAIKTFVTRLMLSDDAAVKLADDPATFNCNKCFGMGSTLGDPAATRTDFFLNPPSDAVKMQAKLKVANQYDSIKDVLLAAGGKTPAPFDLINESSDTVLVTVSSTLVELPAACTAQLSLPGPQPISLPPRDSKPATLEFDCDSSLTLGATADVVLAMSAAGTDNVLASYWIKGRNADVCDVNTDGSVDSDDIDLIMSYRNTPATGPDDPLDIDHDGMITVLDARACTLRCTKAFCAK